MKLSLRQIDLPLRHPFTTAHGTCTLQSNLLVVLEEDCFRGYGEGASTSYYGVTAADMRWDLESLRPQIEGYALGDPADFWNVMQTHLSHNTFAQCALDQAAHDLWGKKNGHPLHRLWNLDPGLLPVSDYTIGLDTVEKMVAKMREFPGWPIYKIKLGTPDDLRIVRELRQHTAAVFRVDANCAWNADDVIRDGPELKRLGVEFIEQPLPAEDLEGMRRAYRRSVLPLIADESCIAEKDVDACGDCFHGVNVKLTKAGGLTPARRMIDRARELGLKVMAGCMTESTVGISAIGQLLPLLDYVDMDGALLIAEDIATGVRLKEGRAIFPDENGSGVRLTEAARVRLGL